MLVNSKKVTVPLQKSIKEGKYKNCHYKNCHCISEIIEFPGEFRTLHVSLYPVFINIHLFFFTEYK